MKVALVHDWLLSYRGGEKVLEVLGEMFPRADLYTLFHKPGAMPSNIENGRRIHTSWLQKIPGALSRHRYLLPFMPKAIERWDLSDYDLVISSSHCVAKGVRVGSARHISYVHAPMRYIWSRYDDYFGPGRARIPVRWAAAAARSSLQKWDKRSTEKVHQLIANSHYIQQEIQNVYGRTSSVVYPPVDTAEYLKQPLPLPRTGQYFLCFGALAPYKRVDLAIEAFRKLSETLWIAGDGQEMKALRRNAPANVKFVGHVPVEEVPQLMQNAKALVFPGIEDFGMTPVEMQALGRPVIAFAGGGALETVTAETGLFFREQTANSLHEAIDAFGSWEGTHFSPAKARINSQRFSKQVFMSEMNQVLKSQGFDLSAPPKS